MKRKVWAALGLALLALPISLKAPELRPSFRAFLAELRGSGTAQVQEKAPGQKPAFDYMSSYLSRNTKPLGLEEDKQLQDLRMQPAVKWVVRAGRRHSLK